MRIRSEDGSALLLALVLGLISVIFLAGLFMLLGTGARLSGIERSYATAVEAARGGAEIMSMYLRRALKDHQVVTTANETDWFSIGNATCLSLKKTKETDEWWEGEDACSECADEALSVEDFLDCYDFKIRPGEYEVYSKITDTRVFTTFEAKKGYIYTVHVLARSRTNSNDKAWINYVYRVEPQ